jgi:hypothetical protein
MNRLFNSIIQHKLLILQLRENLYAVLSKNVLYKLELNIWRGTCAPTYQAFEWHDLLEDLLIDKTQ